MLKKQSVSLVWPIAKLFGINTETAQRKFRFTKYLYYILPVFATLAYIWGIYVNLVLYFSKEALLTCFFSCAANTFGIVAYYLFLKHKKSLAEFRQHLFLLKTGRTKSGYHSLCYTVAVVALLFPTYNIVLYLSIMQVTGNIEISDNLYTSGYSINEIGKFGWVIFIVCLFGTTLVQMTLPVILSCIFSLLCLECRGKFAHVKQEFERHFRAQHFAAFIRIIHLLERVRNVTAKFHDTCYTIVIFMIFNQIVILFWVLDVLIDEYSPPDISEIFEIWTLFSQSIILFIVITVCSSALISEQEDCANVICKIYEHISFESNFEDSKLKKRLKFVMKKDPVVQSAGGFFEVRKSLIFPVIGTVFSYGVILIQVFKESIINKIIPNTNSTST